MFGHKKDKRPEAVSDENKLGLYIHIPFCRSKCDYCDFYSLAGKEDRMDDYQKALLAHLKETSALASGIPVDTVYFGGGTPSYYGEKRLCELLAAIRKDFSLEKGAEISLEANPDSVDVKMLKKLRKAGFNRISMGMQSACPEELKCIHRIHTVDQVDGAVEAARRAGFQNLSLDLIYGLPGQTLESWAASLDHALTLKPEHLSCYGLKVEEGTPLAARVEAGEVLPDDDAQADLYLWTVQRLKEAGFPQYEISNFSRPGRESRHNMRYWLTRPYIGFGPGAHSDFGGRRYSIARDLEGYIGGVLHGGSFIDSDELIPQRERGGEYLMLRLRTVRGVDPWEYRKNFYMDFAPIEARLAEFAQHGWAEKDPDGRWHFTPEGFLVSNQLIGDLLERQEQSTFRDLVRKNKEQSSL